MGQQQKGKQASTEDTDQGSYVIFTAKQGVPPATLKNLSCPKDQDTNESPVYLEERQPSSYFFTSRSRVGFSHSLSTSEEESSAPSKCAPCRFAHSPLSFPNDLW